MKPGIYKVVTDGNSRLKYPSSKGVTMSDKQGAIYLYCSECQWVGENSEVKFWSPEDGAYCPRCDHRDSLIEFAPEMYRTYLKMKDNPVKTVFMMFDTERELTALTRQLAESETKRKEAVQKVCDLEEDARRFPTLAEFSNLQDELAAKDEELCKAQKRIKFHEALMRRRTMSPRMDNSHHAEVELIKVKEQLAKLHTENAALTTERDELGGRVRELEATLAGIRSTLKRNHWHGREVDDLYREEPTK